MMTTNKLKRRGRLIAFGLAAAVVAGSACNVQRAENDKTKKKTAKDKTGKDKTGKARESSKARSADPKPDLKSAAELEKMAEAVEFPELPKGETISFIYGSGIHGGIEPSG